MLRDFQMGYSSACAVKQDGSVWCADQSIDPVTGWFTEQVQAPGSFVRVTGLPPALKVQLNSDGYQWPRACALTEAGELWCWGFNGYDGFRRFYGYDVGVYGSYPDARGTLGTGSTELFAPPAPVSGIRNPTSFSLGGGTICAISLDGSVWCWGNNHMGSVGVPSQSAPAIVPSPVEVTGAAGATQIKVGACLACAIFADQSVRCWADADGVGCHWGKYDYPKSILLSKVEWSPPALRFLAGEGSVRGTCLDVIGNDGSYWGLLNVAGFEDPSAFRSCRYPGGPTNYEDLYLDNPTCDEGPMGCGLRSAGTVDCFGWNDHGELGNGMTSPKAQSSADCRWTHSNDPPAEPAPVPGLSGVRWLRANRHQRCAGVTDGRVLCWGRNGPAGFASLESWSTVRFNRAFERHPWWIDSSRSGDVLSPIEVRF